MRKTIVGVLVCTFLIGAPVASLAAPQHDGDPISSIPEIRAGFGDITRPDDATSPNGMDGTPGACGSAEGAAAYAITPTEPAMLRISITEIDPDAICRVGLYRAALNGDVLDSLYDVGERAAFAHSEQPCGTACSVQQRLGRNTHYLVIWPAGTGDVSQRFSIEGTLRGFASGTASLTGKTVGSCRRIDKGGESDLNFSFSPAAEVAGAQVSIVRVLRPSKATATLETVVLDGAGGGTFVVPGCARVSRHQIEFGRN